MSFHISNMGNHASQVLHNLACRDGFVPMPGDEMDLCWFDDWLATGDYPQGEEEMADALATAREEWEGRCEMAELEAEACEASREQWMMLD